MKITKDDVFNTAQLARLEFDDEKLELFTGQLENILQHIQDLNELNTDNVAPTSHVLDVSTPLREDTVEQTITTEQALQNAPETVDDFFVVPKVIED